MKKHAKRILVIVLIVWGVTLAIPAGAADVITWKMATPVPAGTLMYEYFTVLFTKHVKNLSNGRLIINPYAGGALGPALKVPESVKNGVAECGSTTPVYEVAQDPTSVLFGGYPGSMSDEQYFVWLYENGGEELKGKWRKEKSGVIGMTLGAGTTEIIHSHKPIRTLKDLQGLKMRTTGVWAELLPSLGASAVTLPASEVYPALEKKIVDAIEYADPGNNFPIGFHQIAKYIIVPGVHQPAWPWDLLINIQAWEKLPDDLKTIVKDAAKLTTFESWLVHIDRSTKAMVEFRKSGNEIIQLSDEVLQKVSILADNWAQVRAAKNPWFKQVYENQKAFRENWKNASYIRIR